MGGENVAGEPLTEVLNHVVTLRLAVDQDVEAKFLLDLDNFADLLLDELLVFLRGDFTLGELVSLDTDVLCLGERSNSCGWEQWEVEGLLLLGNTSGEGRLAVVLGLSDRLLSGLDLGVVGPLGGGTGLDSLSIGLELVADSRGALSDGLGNDCQLRCLLDGETEPFPDFGVEVLLALECVWGVEKRAGAGNNDAVLSELLDGKLNSLNGLLEVGLPDVAAVNDTSREDLLGAESSNNGVELLRVSDKVNVDGMEALEVGKNINVVDNVTEVGGQSNTRTLVTEGSNGLVGGLEGSLVLLCKVEHQDGLINLHISGASLLELGKELDVDRNQLVQEGDGVNGLTTVSLSEGQERDWTEDDGASVDSSGLGLEEFNDRLGVGVQLELLVVLESGLDVVVVRVEPFHHFLQQRVSNWREKGELSEIIGTYQAGNVDGSSTVLGGALETTAHGEVFIDLLELVVGVSLRDSLCRFIY